MALEAQLGEEVGIVGKGIGIWDAAMWGMRSGPAEIPTRFVIPAGETLALLT